MNKYKSLAKNTIIFAIGSFGSKFLTILLTRLYASNISPADSSTKELLEITANFLMPLFTISISSALIRFGLDKIYDKRKVFSTSFIVLMAGFIALTIASPLLNLLTYMDGYIILLLFYMLASSLRDLCSQFVRSRQLLKLYSFDGILTTLVLFILNVVFVSKLNLGVSGFMFACIISDFFSSIFLFTSAKLYKYLNLKFYSAKLMKSMVKFSLPLVPTHVMWLLTGFSDRVFLRYMQSDTVFLGAEAAGIYGYASKVPNLLLMVSTIFFQAWNISAITEKDADDRSHFYGSVYETHQSLLFVGSAFLIALVQPISSFFVPSSTFEEYSTVYLYTPILILAVLMQSQNQFLSSIYTATSHTKNSFWTSMVACVANLILNVILIMKFGIQGASVATLLSYLICFVLRLIDTRKLIYFKVSYFDIITNMIALIGMCYVIIKSPPLKIFYLISGLAYICVRNYSGLILTVKKLFKK